MAGKRKASQVVAYYAKRYGVEKGLLWSFMADLFGLKIGSREYIDTLDQAEFLATLEDYLAETRATA